MSAEPDLVVRVPASDNPELASMRLWDLGATAVGEEPGSLVASFPTPEAARAVASELGVAVEEVDAGWRDAWREHAEAVEIGDRLLVAPAWRPVPLAGDRLVLEIDPGPCFGSGSHPSTRLVLGLLAGLGPLGGRRVLDAGCGSGILSVTAALLGATVTAIDIDPAAVIATRANAEANRVAGQIEASTEPVGSLRPGFDLALVNVTAAVHASLGPAVTEVVKGGGWLLLAGLLPGQWRHVAGAYAGADLVERSELDGWEGVTLRRRDASGRSGGAVRVGP